MNNDDQKPYYSKKNQIRHTHSTSAGLEDAMAVLNDIISELNRSHTYANELYKSQNYIVERMEKLIQILREIREGPHAYDPDQPAGLRITIRKR